jgi:hypothetical protein
MTFNTLLRSWHPLMTPLHQILARNAGSVLTPELIVGIVHGYETAISDTVYSTLVTHEPVPPAVDDPRLEIDRDVVGPWVAQRVGLLSGDWGSFAALGLRDDPGGPLVAGCILNNITDTNANAHVAFEGRYALKRCLLYGFFDYAFNQIGLERVTALVDADNADALRFDQHLGFVPEFVIPKGNGVDVVMLVMWKDACRWIKPREQSYG